MVVTGKSLSEALIFALANPQYDDRLFIELQVQYMKIPSSNLGRTCCVQKLFLTFRTIFLHNMFSPYSTKRRASDKDLPVFTQLINQLIETFFWEMLQCVMRYYVHSDKGEKDEVRVVRCKKLWREYTTNGLPSTKVMPATFISLFFVTTKRH